MRRTSGLAAMTVGVLLVAAAAADEPLYLTCQCKAVFNSSFPSRSPKCELYNVGDITAIVDFQTRTVDLKSPDHSPLLKGLAGPAGIAPGTISARWTGAEASQAARKIDLAIDRTSGDYSLEWDFGETRIRWSGVCKKTAALPTQF